MPLLPLLRNWGSTTAGEHVGLTCRQARRRGSSYKYAPLVMGHKANVSKIRYFLFRALGPVLVSATLAKHQGG